MLIPKEYAFFPSPEEPEYGLLLCCGPHGDRWTLRGQPDLVTMMLDLHAESHERIPIGGAWEQREGWPDDWETFTGDPMNGTGWRSPIECAIEAATEDLLDLDILPDNIDPLTADEAQDYIAAVLDDAGIGADLGPTVVCDIPDDDFAAFRVNNQAGLIRIHPLLAYPWLLLQATASALIPPQIHPPGHASLLVALTKTTFGDEAASAIDAALDAFGLNTLHVVEEQT